jgi:hypothetical protein
MTTYIVLIRFQSVYRTARRIMMYDYIPPANSSRDISLVSTEN